MADETNDDPFMDQDRFSVWWKGQEIILGNTDSFRLCQLLVDKKRKNVSHEEIRDKLDKPHMSPDAIRQSVWSLRQKLPDDLARMIVATEGYYCLDLPR